MLASCVLRSWRWGQLFYRGAPDFQTLVKGIATGQTLNLTIPFRAGDLTRVMLLRGRRLEAAATIALEKFIDVLFIAGLCVSLPLFWNVPEWLEGPRVWALWVGLLGIGLAAGLLIPRKTRTYVKKARRKVPLWLFATLLIWTAAFSVNLFVLRALRLDLPALAGVVLLVVMQVGVAVPSTPGKLGVFQYLAVLTLSLFDVTKPRSLAVGLMLHLVVFAPVALVAGFFWLSSLLRKAAPAHQPGSRPP
jgi:uncharacterized membrane protein YbhN (UPF0104 family)